MSGKPDPDFRAASNRLESILAARLLRALRARRDALSINDLALWISAKNVDMAMRLIPEQSIRDSLQPSATIVYEAVLKGGRIGAVKVNEVLG